MQIFLLTFFIYINTFSSLYAMSSVLVELHFLFMFTKTLFQYYRRSVNKKIDVEFRYLASFVCFVTIKKQNVT